MPSRIAVVTLSLAVLAAPNGRALAQPAATAPKRPPPAATSASQESAGDPARAKSKPGAVAEATDKFVRVRRNADGQPLALETAIVTLAPSDDSHRGVRVDLIAAIHVADKAYYQQLTRRFRSYDALLYELVAPEGAERPQGKDRQQSGHPISALQVGLKSLLGLEFQLDCIDYTQPNFVHADMSPKEFARVMKERGESFLQLFFRFMGQAIAEQSKDPSGTSDAQLFMALFAKDRELRLKQIMAEQFEDLGGQLSILDGPEGSTIITERNRKALEVLTGQIKQGKKKIGIFYGAGHLPDMERRLVHDFHFRPVERRWLPAWSLTRD